MLGMMQQRPLLLSSLIEHADRYHGDRAIVSRLADGTMHRSNYRAVAERARRIGNVLGHLGVRHGDRVATLAWNSYRHLELYFGVTGTGAVLHTVNPRLFVEQIHYIIDHAEDRYVFFDLTFAALVEQLAPKLSHVEGWIALCRRDELPGSHSTSRMGPVPSLSVDNLLCYEDLLAAESGEYAWPSFDENTASTLCYTSGTTGNPKGVLYSHRSQMLHTFVAMAADVMAVSARDSIMLVVPLFHANAWGLPFAAAATGAKLVLPGMRLDPESVYTLIRDETCTLAAGIPTIWLNLFTWIEQNRDRLNLADIKLTRVLSGGTAVPRSTIEKFQTLFGTYLLQAWGMTETSPIATAGALLDKHADLSLERRYDLQALQGRSVIGCEVRLVDDAGNELAHDGRTVGELQVRGPWVIAGYFKGEGGQVLDKDGWFRTGDVATITPDGYVQLTDRAKDLVKSGGEWISSVEIENLAVGHPAVHEAAVIAARHPTWQERPLLLIHPKPGESVSKQEMLDYLADKIAKWWLPDDVVIVDELPHTATGKLLKTKLREEYGGWLERKAG
ncbi:MAG: long-chain-fatty-acid--CoA ligase [Acetobacteraceae bacterium]|nr:long-chain-fatty-acid--CoA ligase [Acetobacteraceae bacterium]